MKKGFIFVLVLMLTGCTPVNQKGVGNFSDVGDRENFEEQTEIAVSDFLNRSREELEFAVFCMLEDDGMTVEVIVDDVSYTFTCSMTGDVISVARTDGERFDLRGE